MTGGRRACCGLALILAVAADVADAQERLPQDCASGSIALVRARAVAGDRKAQYVLGAQLSSGKCGNNDPASGLDLLEKSAAQAYAPSTHLLGVIYEREGRLDLAVPLYLAAVGQGFFLAEASLGYAHAKPGTPVYNPVAAYAWLSLALDRETREPVRAHLLESLRQLAAAMSAADTASAGALKARLAADLAVVARFTDDP